MKKQHKLKKMGETAVIALLVGILCSNMGADAAANTRIADVKTKTISLKEEIPVTNYDSYSYTADVSPISVFYDETKAVNLAYDGKNSFHILKLDSKDNVNDTLTIAKKYPLLGGVAYDNGFYYVVYGKENETDNVNQVVMSVVKYNKEGKETGEVTYTGKETEPYSGDEWGTKEPFRAGNCDIMIDGDVLVCSYAREMYSGHQSNHVLYVDINQMTKLPTAPSYTSHSFDQRVIAAADGSYLFADHGDAYERGFNITKIIPFATDIWRNEEFTSFHFREGANRDHGYNETYAQLGGIAECSTGYVLAGSSEKTLSFDTAPTNRGYCGHSESRNLFIQILKKDFSNYVGADCFAIAGEDRKAVGTPPASAETELRLKYGVEDSGVIWLTDYADNQFYCASPKVIVTSDDKIVLLWEKLQYAKKGEYEDKFIDSYVMILDSTGKIVQEATSLAGVRLDKDEDVLYNENEIVWAVKSEENTKNISLYRLNLSRTLDKNGFKSEKPTIKTVKSPKKKTITVQLNKDSENLAKYGTRKYICEISQDKNFKKTVKKYKIQDTLQKTAFTSKKTYYVRVRAYMQVDGKRIYSKYSPIKKVKVK